MNSENGSLQLACDLQETPSKAVWVSIEEQLDRAQLGQLLETHAETPTKDLWRHIRPTRGVSARQFVVISLALGLLAGITYRLTTISPFTSTRSMAALPVAVQDQSIQNQTGKLSGPTPPKSTSGNTAAAEAAFSNARIAKNLQPAQAHEDMNYVWVAAQNGKPIRVPKKWSSLSCCLSGEMKSTDCKMQQDAWHTEVACSGLGFQADPILGLMELMDESGDR